MGDSDAKLGKLSEKCPMTSKTPEMIDMVFDLESATLPSAYPFALWKALLRHSPQLATEKSAGILPLRATENNEGIFLTKRTKLVLRLPLSNLMSF